MPTEGSVLNFKSSWYPDGYTNAVEVKLPGGEKIHIFSLPYFLASKIEAFIDRGHGDFLTSPDMEDVIAVLDGAENLTDEFVRAPVKIKKYLNTQFSTFLKDERFLESLEGNLRSAGRIDRIKKLLAGLY
ncbi:MAG: hypothetical protein NTY45_06485, partial [Elusimicrobia bacterium]|nr:hypothetical protein [Elusimicrobiota bacterium]